jgi:hypothetical protein
MILRRFVAGLVWLLTLAGVRAFNLLTVPQPEEIAGISIAAALPMTRRVWYA